ncbi:MAG: cupredoxin domain-containing protein [Coriobacteriia bacterium]|nr:cupredoxin domain-containing protein [Coriobacteriia bacterium]
MTDKSQESAISQTYSASSRTKFILIAAAVVFAFGAAYSYAAQRAGSGEVAQADALPYVEGSVPGGTGQAGGACACCGGGPSEPIEGSATLGGDVQRIAVDVSGGYYDPNIINAKAGVPIEITFNEGAGCLAEVQFPDFGVFEDLTGGGAVVKLPALEAGTYGFSCGMQMVFGTLVVE